MLPQVARLIKLKKSEEHSLLTWGAWTVGQFVSLAYAIVVGAYAYALLSVGWIGLYGCMVILVLKYREKPAVIKAVAIDQQNQTGQADIKPYQRALQWLRIENS
jgi:uncharacterized protein with PQ loop repeat